MFPIRDHNPSEKTPYVTYALIAINALVFLSYWPLFADQRQLQSFFMDWALVPSRVAQGSDLHTLITSMFLHGGFLHLAGMLASKTSTVPAISARWPAWPMSGVSS